jgi:uncharacterized protein (TIGR02594 family)
MIPIAVTPFDLAHRFLGLKEVEGPMSNPAVLAMLQLDAKWVEDDETAWCSAFVNYPFWLLNLPRSRSLAARSWLLVGQSIPLTDAQRGFDVVILKRGKEPQPGPEVIKAQGHVGLYAGHAATTVDLLGGNQGDTVSIASFKKPQILGVRRIIR